MKIFFLMSCLIQALVLCNSSIAQNLNTTQITIKAGNKPLPVIMLDPVYFVSDRVFANNADRLKYLKLKRDVKIAFIHAKDVVKQLNSLDYELLQCTSKKERKLLINRYYNQLKGQIVSISKELTPAQGKIILKLIYRQTGFTTYQLLSDKLNSLNASLMQLIAISLGQDLKSTYSVIQDYEIESIVKQLEANE